MGILARVAEAASLRADPSADPRELRCLELCATPAMLQHCFGDEKDMDKSYHFCHTIKDPEFNGTVPCLKQCLAGDTDPKSQLINEKLIRISKNIISCSEDALTFAADDLSTTRIAEITETLQRCGVVFIPGLLSASTAGNALDQMFPADTETLTQQLLRDPRQWNRTEYDETNKTKLPFPPNLRGGRFQIVPDADDAMHRAVAEVTESVIPLVLEKFWKGSKPLLGFITAIRQAAHTWDQPFHVSRETTEEARLQIALDDYDKSAGPIELYPVSHYAVHALGREMWKPFQDTLLAAFRPLIRVPAKAGDAILYSSSTFRRGTATSGSSRTSLVFMMQSVGRRFHASDMMPVVLAHSFQATAIYRALWFANVRHAGSDEHADAAQRFIASLNGLHKRWANSPRGTVRRHRTLSAYLTDRVNAQESTSKFLREAMLLSAPKLEL